MEEDIAIINTNTRNERIKNFFINNKKKIILSLSIILIIFVSSFAYIELKKKRKIAISDKYNSIIIDYSEKNKVSVANNLINIINEKDETYSPLSLYFIIDNKLISDKKKINDLFRVIIDKTPLDTEIKNLNIYKQGLYNADFSSESELLEILNPLINSKSIWKSHALYLVAEYFYSKDEKQKSKEFFSKVLSIENANADIIKETQKRLNRDLSD
tara:strand:- start:402 stop:1046 length:645 start_codon:yes stop_codon:yes gene_type:complete